MRKRVKVQDHDQKPDSFSPRPNTNGKRLSGSGNAGIADNDDGDDGDNQR